MERSIPHCLSAAVALTVSSGVAQAAFTYEPLFKAEWADATDGGSTGRGTYFTARTSLDVAGFEVFSKFANGIEFDLAIFEGNGQGASGTGDELAVATLTGAGGSASTYFFELPFSFTAGEEYVLVVRPRSESVKFETSAPVKEVLNHLSPDTTSDDFDTPYFTIQAPRSGRTGENKNYFYVPAFTVVIPEPATIALAGLGLYLILRRR